MTGFERCYICTREIFFVNTCLSKAVVLEIKVLVATLKVLL